MLEEEELAEDAEEFADDAEDALEAELWDDAWHAHCCGQQPMKHPFASQATTSLQHCPRPMGTQLSPPSHLPWLQGVQPALDEAEEAEEDADEEEPPHGVQIFGRPILVQTPPTQTELQVQVIPLTCPLQMPHPGSQS
ncbi:hypothetical protein HYR82_02940 [Candidatus Peregrinibacteria bacterium]|nr:hypothetical protein [Candidatus Peregrinibacteria bacterium]